LQFSQSSNWTSHNLITGLPNSLFFSHMSPSYFFSQSNLTKYAKYDSPKTSYSSHYPQNKQSFLRQAHNWFWGSVLWWFCVQSFWACTLRDSVTSDRQPPMQTHSYFGRF
jgi:hypothetical protein